MPGMTGVELLERARTLAPDAKRMLVTAYADMQAVIDAVNRGQVTRYFVKPWDRAELLAALEDALKIARLELRIREVEGPDDEGRASGHAGAGDGGHRARADGPGGLPHAERGLAAARHRSAWCSTCRTHLATDPDAEVAARRSRTCRRSSRTWPTGAEHLREVALGLRAQARGEDMEATADVAEVVSFAVKLARAEVRDRARLTSSGEPVRVVVRAGEAVPGAAQPHRQRRAGHGGHGPAGPHRGALGGARRRTWCCTVADNGCGIPLELQEKVFQPLFTTKPVGIGTGLGLSICKELVTQFGGQLRLSSTPGEGTEIELTLRRAPLP